MLFASILISAAMTFCAENPNELRCTDAPVTPAPISSEQREAIDALADDIRIGVGRYSAEGNRDVWRAAGPNEPGDCEDRLLWAVRELQAIGLGDAVRFVAVEEDIDNVGARRVRRMHLILVIEGQDERIVLDTQFGAPRPWSAYARRNAYSPIGGLGGSWAPY